MASRIDALLEKAEHVEREVPAGHYSGPPEAERKSTAGEMLRSVEGTGRRQIGPGFDWSEPTARVTSRGTLQLIWQKAWGGFALAFRRHDAGGSVGFERFGKGDLPPDPEHSPSAPMSYVISEAVHFLTRRD